MQDQEKTREQLLDMVMELRRQVAEYQASDLERQHREAALRENQAQMMRDLTERTQMEESLRQSEERYRTVIEDGMDSYISKPIKNEELFVAIEQAICIRPQTEEIVPAAALVEDVFDQAESLSCVDGDMGLLLDIAEIFLETCPADLAEIRQAIVHNDAEALARAAHTLKGAVGNFGLKSAYQAAKKLEQIGQEGKLIEGINAYTELMTEIDRLKAALVALCQEHRPVAAC